MQTLTLYEEATIPAPQPMPDAPPVAPPRTTLGTFSYVRGQEPPGMNTRGYRPFAGANSPGGPPIQPPPTPPM